MARKPDPNSKRQIEIETTKENAEREAAIEKYLAHLKCPSHPDVKDILQRLNSLALKADTVLRFENKKPFNEGRLILIKNVFDVLSKDETLHFFLLDFLARNYGQSFPAIRDLKMPGRFDAFKQDFPIPEGHIDIAANEPDLPFFVEVKEFCELVTAHDAALYKSLEAFREKNFDRSHWSNVKLELSLQDIARGLDVSVRTLLDLRNDPHALKDAIRQTGGEYWQINYSRFERYSPGAYDRIIEGAYDRIIEGA